MLAEEVESHSAGIHRGSIGEEQIPMEKFIMLFVRVLEKVYLWARSIQPKFPEISV